MSKPIIFIDLFDTLVQVDRGILEPYFDRETDRLGDNGTLRNAKSTIQHLMGLNPKMQELGSVEELANYYEMRMRDLICNPPQYVIEMLDELRNAGYPICVISDAAAVDVAHWAESPLASRIDKTVFSYEVGYIKPDLRLFEIAKQAMGEPEVSFFIGDGGHEELMGAKLAGLKTIKAEWLKNRREDAIYQYADYTIQNTKEVLEAVKHRADKHTLYGVHFVHPMAAMSQSTYDELPHNQQNANVVLFSDEKAARAYMHAHEQDKKAKMTHTPFGPNLNQYVTFGQIAVLYQVACPDNLYQQMQVQFEQSLQTQERQGDWSQSIPFHIQASVAGMQVEKITVHFPQDPIHGSLPHSLWEMGSEMAHRQGNYLEMEKSLKNSTPKMLQQLDFNNLQMQDSLYQVYGTPGLINTDFFTSDRTMDQLRSIQRQLVADQVGIAYMYHMHDIEREYESKLHAEIENGINPDVAAARAAYAVAGMLENIAEYYDDTPKVHASFTRLKESLVSEAGYEEYNPYEANPFDEDISDTCDEK